MTHHERHQRRQQILRWKAEGRSVEEIVGLTGLSFPYISMILRRESPLIPVFKPAPMPKAKYTAEEQARNQKDAQKAFRQWQKINVLTCRDYPGGKCSTHDINDRELVELPDGKYAALCEGKLSANWRELGFAINPVQNRFDRRRRQQQK